MAKADVVLKFDVATADFIQKTLAAKAALDATAKTARDAGNEVAKSGDKLDKFGKQAEASGRDAAAAITKIVAIPAMVIGGMIKVAEMDLDRLKKKADEYRKDAATLNSALAETGQSNRLPGVRLALSQTANKNLYGERFSQDFVEDQFVKIHTAGRGRTSINDDIAGTRASLSAIIANRGTEDATAIGSGVATLRNLMPSLSDQDAETMAIFLQANGKGVLADEKSLGIIARSQDKMGTAQFLAAGFQGFQPGRHLAGLLNDIETPISTRDLSSMSGDNRTRAKNLMQLQQGGGDVLGTILANPSAYLSPDKLGSISAVRAGMRNFRQTGSMADEVRQARLNDGPEGEAVRMARRTDQIVRDTLEKGGASAAAQVTLAERLDAEFKRDHPWLSMIPGIPAMARNGLFQNFSELGKGYTIEWGGEDGLGVSRNSNTGGTDKKVLELMEEANAYSREQIANSRRALLNSAGGPMLRNDTEGQK